ncbi:MAG: UvrD-helicase domain-containing protein [Clostridia bacterium]|nr:UvrD-helicase domain-containing protein [Clostridia bacterium]
MRMKKELNTQQRKVAENLSENILLFATAGTGKTFAVANRVANILRVNTAKAEQILCLTFTIKAANEMREDVFAIAGKDAEKVCIQTVHGFCYRLIKEEEHVRGGKFLQPQVIDEVDEEMILQNLYLSHAREWLLDDVLRRHKRKETAEWLKAQPIVSYRGQLGWRIDGAFLSVNGAIHLDPAPNEFVKPRRDCPRCGADLGAEESACSICGEPLGSFLSFDAEEKPVLFQKKKNPMMSIVTVIKHARAEYGLYSGSAIEDYFKAWERFRLENEEAYMQLFSFYKAPASRGKSARTEIDETVEQLLCTHAGELVAEYEETLLRANQLDFDDLILGADRLLSDEETCRKYRERYSFIIIDEMQDTSRTEYGLLKKLFAGNNVMMCGDFFQTIYGWRGSAPNEIISDFQTRFSPTVYAFNENYRATKTLTEASFAYLKNTYPKLLGRFCPEEIVARSENVGGKILCFGFDNYKEEAAQIYAYAQKYRPQSVGDLCIMARSNSYIAMMSQVFERLNAAQKKEEDKVRFFTVEKDHGFFKRACVKDVLAVLKLIVNPADSVSLERIAARYIRGVGARTLQELRALYPIGISACSFLDENTIRGIDPYQVLIDGAKNKKIVVYDTETTGLDLEKDEMVQLSAVRLGENGEIEETLDLMIEPTVSIGQGAYETHGFDLDYIRSHGGVSAKEVLERFSAFAKGCVLVGHNSLRFDAPLIRRQMKEQGLPPLGVMGEYDTLAMAKLFLPALPDYKLSTLCAHYGVVNEAAHNALGDITATAKVLFRMIAENVIPTAERRKAVVEKFAPKFEKFFIFYRQNIDMTESGRVAELVPTVIERMGLVKRYDSEGDREALRDLADTLSVASVYDGEAFLASFLSDAALAGSQMDVLLKKLQKIPVITVHQAKGCEFSTVILAGVSERFFPSSLSKGTPQEEEEKKVFYVAITRAKERLIMTRVTKDFHTGERIPVSPYFRAIPSRYVQEYGEF